MADLFALTQRQVDRLRAGLEKIERMQADLSARLRASRHGDREDCVIAQAITEIAESTSAVAVSGMAYVCDMDDAGNITPTDRTIEVWKVAPYPIRAGETVIAHRRYVDGRWLCEHWDFEDTTEDPPPPTECDTWSGEYVRGDTPLPTLTANGDGTYTLEVKQYTDLLEGDAQGCVTVTEHYDDEEVELTFDVCACVYLQTSCCTGVALPTRIRGTVSNKNSPCMSVPTDIEATWDSLDTQWETASGVTDCYQYIGLDCSSGMWSGPVGGVGGGVGSSSVVSSSCDPFEVVIDYYITTPGDGFRVTWTI